MSEQANEAVHKKCGCCGAEFEALIPPSSTKEGDWFDLDQRPPEPIRSELYRQIFRCPECGFACGPRDRRAELSFVKSDDYLSCEGNDLPDGKGADYYRFGMLAEKDGDKATAFEAFLRAAWVFDDAGDDESAVKCRGRLIKMCVGISSGTSYDALVITDIYRRAGRFSELPEDISKGSYPDSLTNIIMEFQKKLAAKGDRKAYTLEQCFEESGIKR